MLMTWIAEAWWEVKLWHLLYEPHHAELTHAGWAAPLKRMGCHIKELGALQVTTGKWQEVKKPTWHTESCNTRQHVTSQAEPEPAPQNMFSDVLWMTAGLFDAEVQLQCFLFFLRQTSGVWWWIGTMWSLVLCDAALIQIVFNAAP